MVAVLSATVRFPVVPCVGGVLTVTAGLTAGGFTATGGAAVAPVEAGCPGGTIGVVGASVAAGGFVASPASPDCGRLSPVPSFVGMVSSRRLIGLGLAPCNNCSRAVNGGAI